ncbi:hypothetical protein ACEPAG_2790 [Sanghuangporus baumii]
MEANSALIVVDVQYDFLPGGSLAVPEGDQVVPVINKLLKEKKWSFVAASQDYHPPGHVSFASTHKKELFSQIDVPLPYAKEGMPTTIPQVMWPDHCVQGTHGAEIEQSVLKSLKPWFESDKGLILQKGTDISIDVYSAFGCAPGFSPDTTQLASELRKRGITKLFVVGLATDYCARATALDARKAGFDVTVIREAVRAVGGEKATQRVEAEWREAGIKIVGMQDVTVE